MSRSILEQKVLLMGRANAGKSSMKSVIFADSSPVDTQSLSATHNIDHRRVALLGDLGLSLWDCGGQDVYLDSYLNSTKDLVFQNVACLIFVVECHAESSKPFDTKEGSVWEAILSDVDYLRKSMSILKESSPGAKVFLLIHKTDLIPPPVFDEVITRYKNLFMSSLDSSLLPSNHIMDTSIWNETLYHAWSTIARALMPQVHRLEAMLSKLATVLHADDLILLEKNTFLTIAHAQPHIALGYHSRSSPSQHLTAGSFERLSNVIKQFKITCMKGGGNFQTMQVNLSDSSILIERFTDNLYIVIALPHRDANLGAVMLNLDLAYPVFEAYEKLPTGNVSSDGIIDQIQDTPGDK